MDSSFNSSPMIEKKPLDSQTPNNIYPDSKNYSSTHLQINYFIPQESNESTINNGEHSNFSLSDSLVNDFLNQNSYTSDESIKLNRNVDIDLSFNNENNINNDCSSDNSIYPHNNKINNKNENTKKLISKESKYKFDIIFNI